MEFEIFKLSLSDATWYGQKRNDLLLVRYLKDGWFPRKEYMGITNNKFDYTHPKTIKNGIVMGNGNLGSGAMLVLDTHRHIFEK